MSDDGPKTRTRGKRPVTEEPKPVKKQPKPKTVYDVSQLQDIGINSIYEAHQLRIYSIQMTIASNSGHLTSCASMAEIMSVLFFTKAGMHYNPKDPKNFGNDRFVLSKGHAAPILYAAWAIAGFVDPAELLKLRKFDSDLEGHPTPKLPFVDVATGSLGQGLSVAGGMAYSSKYLDKIDNRYWVVIGDGECAEGSIWEAAHLASYYKLDNLTAILDINRLGQSQETSIGHDIEVYKKRFEAFGWSVIKVDGHNITALAEAMEKKHQESASNYFGQNLQGEVHREIENELDWHGKPVPASTIEHLKSLQKSKTLQFDLTPEVPESREWPERHHFTLATEYAADGKQSKRKHMEGFGCFEQGRYKSLDCGSGWRHQELNFCLNIQGCYSNQFRGVSELKNVFSRVPIALIRGLVQIASALRSSRACSRAFSAQITSSLRNA